MRLAQKVALQPTPRQERELRKHAAARRWAWNWGLARKKDMWKERRSQLDSGVDKTKIVVWEASQMGKRGGNL